MQQMFLFPSSATPSDLQFNYSSSDRSDTMTSSTPTPMTTTKKKNLKDLLTSKDWMGTYQENHVDIDLKNSNPFSSAATSTSNNAVPLKGGQQEQSKEEQVPALKHQDAAAKSSSSSTTDWMGEYYQSLGAGSSEASATASLKKSFALPRSRQTSLTTKPLSRSSSKQSAGGNKPSMDSFKMSVDMSAFLTPSMDAAMEQIQQEEERLEQQQDDEDEASAGVVSGLTAGSTRRPNGSSYASKDAAMMLLSNSTTQQPPLPMDTDDEANAAVVDVAKIVALTEQSKAEQLHKVATRPKKKKKKPRRNKEPDVKVYVEPNDTDVLLGRGGRSNHHVGNVAYRTEVGNLRDWYRSSEKNAKTDLSQLLVDWVHKEQQGRFLKLDTAVQRWYIVTNIVARRKASQALREHMTREERALKKQQQGT